MKRIAFILLLFGSSVQAQMVVTGKLRHAKAEDVLHFNVPYENWYYDENTVEVRPDMNGEFAVRLNLQQPQVFFLRFGKKSMHLYGAPDKTLSLKIDSLQPDTVLFAGDLAEENALWNDLGLSWNTLYPETWNDTVTSSADIFTLIQYNQQRALSSLDELVKETSPAFRRITRGNIQYFAISKLWQIFFRLHQQKIWPNIDEWKNALTRAYSARNLSDDDVLESYHYQNAVTYYPRYVQMKEGRALAEKMLHMPVDSVKAKGERHLIYKLLEYGLEGRSLERAKASFVIHGIYQGEMSYLAEAYEDFINRYPSSIYMPKVKEVAHRYLAAKERETLFAFITDDRYESVEDIISAHKGRVLYIDMWGTWCGPCREQFKYAATLKERFKNEPVEFVYVAIEKATGREKVWKETVSFYNLQGTHILAGKELAADFMDLYKNDGDKTVIFPSYLLVDRNGVIVTSWASPPSSGDKLYDEIIAVLRKK